MKRLPARLIIDTTRKPSLEGNLVEVRSCNRHGFTIVELLVVLGIITILLGLLLPAVQNAREASRNTQCKHHLRSLGLAVMAFEDSYATLPAPRSINPKTTNPVSVHALLLPYVEQSPLYEQIVSGKLHVSDPAIVRLPLMLCPSDTGTGHVSYRVCMGTLAAVFANSGSASNRGGMADGAFVHRKTDNGRTLAEIVDGLSNTVAMSECLTGNGQRNFDHSRDLWYSAGAVLDPNWNHSSEWMARTCRILGDAVPTTAYSSLQGRFLLDASYANTEYNHIFLPNAREASCSADSVPQPHTGEDPSQGTWVAAIKASSSHSGRTVNVLMLDGSVASATDQMSLEIWQNMARIDDSK